MEGGSSFGSLECNPEFRIRNWGVLCGDVIDKIANYLISQGLWREVGPSLRILNKNWCSHVNNSVTRAHPRFRRPLQEEDLDSLVEFQNLTSVDFTAFLLCGRDPRDSCELFWSERSVSEKKRRILVLLDKLKQLPKLSVLYVSMNILDTGCIVDLEVKEAMMKLTGVRKLKLGGSSRNVILSYYECYLFSQLRIEEIEGPLYVDDIPLMTSEWFPRLKTTTAGVVEDFSANAKSYIVDYRITDLQFEQKISIKDLLEVTSVAALKVNVLAVEHIERIIELEHLKNVALTTDIQILNRASIPNFSRLILNDFMPQLGLLQLERLTLSPRLEHGLYMDLPDQFFESLPGLRVLSLTSCCFKSKALLRPLQNLNELYLEKCAPKGLKELCSHFDSRESPVGRTLRRLRVLEVLGVDGVSDIKEVTMHGLDTLVRTRNLRRLVVRRHPVIYASIDYLKRLAACKGLRELEIKGVCWRLQNEILEQRSLVCFDFLHYLSIQVQGNSVYGLKKVIDSLRYSKGAPVVEATALHQLWTQNGISI